VSGMRPARVTFVSDSDAWGGAEVYLTHLVRHAAGLGWAASLVCAAPVVAGFRTAVPHLPCAVVPLARHTASAPEVGAAVAAQRPDVVAVNLVDPGSNAAAVAAALAVAPTTATLHLAGSTVTGAQREALAALLGRLGAVLTPSADGRALLLDDLGLRPDRVHVVPNGVPVPPDPVGPAGGSVPRLGALGRLTAQKGFDVLLEAVGGLVAEGLRFDVVIGGDGRDADALRSRAQGLPVAFPGFVSDVRGFLAGLDLFCLSSRREALPLVLLEAMAEGLPCVATDVGAVREAVGEDAVVVPAEDPGALTGALRPLLLDAGRRTALGTAAHRRAEAEFDAGLMARRTFAHLEEVVHDPAAGRVW
jgi:glycosyltransferase involved in cell wall biosynthesis